MEFVTLIGAAAALASMVSFAPQAFKIIRTRDVSSISAAAFAVTVAAFALWLAYGAMKMDWPLIATNSVNLALSAFILTMKLLPQQKRDKVADALDPGA